MFGYVQKASLALLVVAAIVFSACTAGQPPPQASPAAGAKSATLRVGFVPNSALGAIISMYMRDNKLIEKRAKELGVDLKIDWREFPGAPPEIQAMIAKDLDVAGTGFLPTSRAILQGQDIHYLSLYEGRLKVWLAVRPGSPIRTIDDLKGKTIGTFVGGDIQFFLTQVLRAHTGVADPAQLDIKVVNVPSAAAMENMPAGIDAVTIFGPNYLSGVSKGTLVGLVSNQGDTGPAWIDGQGKEPREFKNSAFYPEAYMLHRAVWAARGEVIRNSPELIEALLMAQQDAIRELRKMSPAQAAALAKDVWKIPGEVGAVIVETDLLWERPWTWFTLPDLQGLARNGVLALDAKIIDKAITLEQILDNVKIVAPIAKRAYERIQYPEPSAFTDPKAKDVRGLPFWEVLK